MAKLGSKKKPAIVCVQTEARAGEILQLCVSHGWQVMVGVELETVQSFVALKLQ